MHTDAQGKSKGYHDVGDDGAEHVMKAELHIKSPRDCTQAGGTPKVRSICSIVPTVVSAARDRLPNAELEEPDKRSEKPSSHTVLPSSMSPEPGEGMQVVKAESGTGPHALDASKEAYLACDSDSSGTSNSMSADTQVLAEPEPEPESGRALHKDERPRPVPRLEGNEDNEDESKLQADRNEVQTLWQGGRAKGKESEQPGKDVEQSNDTKEL